MKLKYLSFLVITDFFSIYFIYLGKNENVNVNVYHKRRIKGVVIMFNLETIMWLGAIWQIFIIVVILGFTFGIPYYLIQSLKHQKRIEKKLDKIIVLKKRN